MSASADPLILTLETGRKRLRARMALAMSLAALTVGSLVFLGADILEAARRLELLALTRPVPVAALALGGAVFGAVAVVLASRWWTPSGNAPLALMIDQRAGLDLAYATAVETDAASSSGPVAQALLSQSRKEAATFDMARLMPLWVWPLRLALIAGVVAGAAALTLHRMLPPIPMPEPARPAMDMPSSSEETRARAEDLARNLAREAGLRQDPMLSAIARAIKERVAEAAPDAGAEELESELAALADQARSAFGENIPDWLGDTRTASQTEGANVPAAQTAQSPDGPAESIDTFAVNMEDIEQARRAQAAMPEAEGDDPDAGEAGQGRAASGNGDLPEGFSFAPKKIEADALQAAGREAIGAAKESGSGPSEQAGDGSRALGGEALTEAAEGETSMPLPQAAQETGRRIRITLPPSGGDEAASGEAGGTASARAGIAANKTMERPTVPAAQRGAVGRYFERMAE